MEAEGFIWMMVVICAYFLGRKDMKAQIKKEEIQALANRQMDYLKKRGLW